MLRIKHREQILEVELSHGMNTCVSDIKEEIERISGVSCLQQKLIYCGKILQDELSLKESNVDAQKMLVLIVGPSILEIQQMHENEQSAAREHLIRLV